MFKAIVLLALVAFACGSDPILGGYYASQDITQAVVDTANWATNELTTTYNYAGEYHTANIRDYTVQVVSGYNRRFTVDYVVVFGDNNYRVIKNIYLLVPF